MTWSIKADELWARAALVELLENPDVPERSLPQVTVWGEQNVYIVLNEGGVDRASPPHTPLTIIPSCCTEAELLIKVMRRAS